MKKRFLKLALCLLLALSANPVFAQVGLGVKPSSLSGILTQNVIYGVDPNSPAAQVGTSLLLLERPAGTARFRVDGDGVLLNGKIPWASVTNAPLTGSGGQFSIIGNSGWDTTAKLNITNGATDFGRTNLVLTGRFQAGNDGWQFGTAARNTIVFASNAYASGVNVGGAGTEQYSLQVEGNSNSLGFLSRTVGNTPVMTLVQSGNVGIGTTGPAEKLHISGGNVQIDPSGGGQAWLGRVHAEGGEIKLTSTAGGTGGWIQGYSSGLRFVDYGWNRTTFSVDNNGNGFLNGNLGIGTNAPIGKLHVYAGGAGGVGWGTGLNVGDSSNYTGLIQDGGVSRWRNTGVGGWDWYNSFASTRIMALDNGGNFTVSGTISANGSGLSNVVATKVGGYASSPDDSHSGSGVRPFYSWGGSNCNGSYPDGSSCYANGITIGSHPSDPNYGFQIVQNMWDDRLLFRRYDYGWKGWRTIIDSSTIGSQSVNYATNAGNAETVDGYHASNFMSSGADNWVNTTGDTMSGNLSFNNYGLGMVGVYSDIRYQGVFSMGPAYMLSADGTSAGSLYGIAWTHSNIGGQSRTGLGHQALFMENGVTQTAIGNGVWTRANIQAAGSVTGAEMYTSGWFRNTNSGTGLYNQANGNHFYSSSGKDWNITAADPVNGYPALIFRSTHNSTIRGQVYSDSGGFGLLSSDNTWRIRTAPGSQELYGTTYSNDLYSYWLSNRYGVDTNHPFGVYFGSGQDQNYAIFRESGAWTNPYPDMRIAFHTGIKIGAHFSYNGIRFYNNSDMVTETMSIGDTDNNVRVAYALYVGGAISAGGDIKAGNLNNRAVNAGRLTLGNSDWHNWGTSVIDGRVWSSNSNIHLSPPSGYNVEIDTRFRDAGGGAAVGTAGLIVTGNVITYASIGVGLYNPAYNLHLVNDSAGKPNGGSWSNSSDVRLKKNFQDIDGASALDKLSKLQGKTFEWINPENHAAANGEVRASVMAQNLRDVFPQWVSEIDPSGKDKELIPEGEKALSISFPNDFNAYLIEAIKELKKENDNLRARVEVLENK